MRGASSSGWPQRLDGEAVPARRTTWKVRGASSSGSPTSTGTSEELGDDEVPAIMCEAVPAILDRQKGLRHKVVEAKWC